MNRISLATQLIKNKGWVQGASNYEGKHCISGALNCYRANNIEFHYIAEVALEQFPERIEFTDGITPSGNDLITIIRFNDHPNTTVEDVLAVMEKAAVKLYERA